MMRTFLKQSGVLFSAFVVLFAVTILSFHHHDNTLESHLKPDCGICYLASHVRSPTPFSPAFSMPIFGDPCYLGLESSSIPILVFLKTSYSPRAPPFA